jgi:hypothetical protein
MKSENHSGTNPPPRSLEAGPGRVTPTPQETSNPVGTVPPPVGQTRTEPRQHCPPVGAGPPEQGMECNGRITGV